MPGRTFSSPSYRYGFNGKEKTDEMHNSSGTSYDYGMRIYDSRLGRFLSVDPIAHKYAMLTPYQFGSNRPIDGIDRDGLEWFGCTSIISASVSGVAGLGYGINLSLQIGTAFDMIGTTQYIAYKALTPINQDLKDGTFNPQFLLGADLSGDIGVYVEKEPTFAKAFNEVSYSMSTVSLKFGVGGSGSINNSGGGISIGLGIGGHFETGNNTNLIQSVSITTAEKDKTLFGSIWIVGDPAPIKNSTGEITGYSASLLQAIPNSAGPPVFLPTGLKVYSEVAKTEKAIAGANKVETTYSPKGNWKTDSYKKEEAVEDSKSDKGDN